MESFIQVLIHLWHVEILIVCVLDKITVLFSIFISSKIYLKNSYWSTDWSWWETKTYTIYMYIYCVNYIKLHQESMKVCFCWRKNEIIQYIFFIYYLAIMPQNSSQGTKSQNFLGGLIAPPKPPAAYGIFHSSIDSFMTCRNINSLCTW